MRGVRLGSAHELDRVGGTAAARRPDRGAGVGLLEGDHASRCDRAASPLVVTVLFAKRSSASLISSTITMQPSRPGGVENLLDDRCAAHETARAGAHRPDSARAFSTLMPRNSADGQPWLTGATWPGWPLPQLKAPPRR